ncbi:carboxypeptidase regulatory-like domain-containing protein [bacterium]|nr:carboxypeptidase regulatory-like domain-containing protein [bacterium]
MKKTLIILGIVAMTAVSSAEEYATLSGVVTDEAGNPIQWAIIRVEGTDVHLITLEDGTTSFADIPPGRYTVKCSAPGYVDSTIEDVLLVAGIRSTVTFILKRPPEDAVLTIEKPNIYLYPEETTEVSVRLDFPQGGGVTVSDPPYGFGWEVEVTPEGEIDGTFDYLFYEAEVPGEWNMGHPYVVGAEDVEGFFRENLELVGFRGREIEDFVSYWVPRLNAHPYYLLHPNYAKDIDPHVTLDINPEPDSLLRLYYYIEGMDEDDERLNALRESPAVPIFKREGFTVVEWGVCLDGVIQ